MLSANCDDHADHDVPPAGPEMKTKSLLTSSNTDFVNVPNYDLLHNYYIALYLNGLKLN
jgi:hypothetical protein